jgi:hypothetical protein
MQYDDGLSVYDNAVDEAEAAVINMGLPLNTRPVGRDEEFADVPRMPIDLSKSSFQELTYLIGRFTEWYGYSVGQLKLAEGRRNAAEKKRTFAWSRIRKLKSGTVSDKDDAVRTDSRYLNVDGRYEHWDAMVRLLGGIVEGLKRDVETISRSITVLESRTGAEGRGVAAGRKGRGDAQTAFRRGRRDHQEPKGRSAMDVFKKRR